MPTRAELSLHHDHRTVLENILDRQPLTADPTMRVGDAIQLMSRSWASQCQLNTSGNSQHELHPSNRAHSAVLVMSEGKVQGILTERDLVRFVSMGTLGNEQTLEEVICSELVTLKLSEFQDFFSLMHLMRHYRIQHLPLLDEDERFIGLVTFETLRQLFQPSDLLRFRQLKEVLVTEVICASPTDTIQFITQVMAQHNISCVVIVENHDVSLGQRECLGSENDRYPIGIMTERDIVQFQFLELDFDQTLAQQVMSRPLFLMNKEDSVWQAHQRMQEMRVRRLVVTRDSGQLAGIITQSTLLQMLDPAEMYRTLEALQTQVHQLQSQNEKLLHEKALSLEQELESNRLVRLQTEERLNDSEASYQVLATNLPAVVYRLFPGELNRMVFLNEYHKTLIGCDEQELKSGEVCSIDPFILEEDRGDVIKSVRTAIADYQPFTLNYRVLNKTGQICHLWEQAQPVFNAAQVVSHYDGVIFDVTERKNIEQALKTERDFNAAVLETVGALVLVLDPQAKVIRFNQACVNLTGYSLDELQETTIWDRLIVPEELESTQAVFKQLIQGKYPSYYQNHWMSKDGTKHLINWSNTVLTDDAGAVTHVIATGIDVSEKQKLEEQFLRAQRLESIGTLASGIAHDLNNILTPILAISQLLPLKNPDLDEQSQHLLQVMQESAKRGATLVKQVLTFSRGIDGDRTNIQLRHIISEIRDIALKTFPKSINVIVDLPRDLWQIHGDPTQLHQVLMNLCVNARDAMGKNGGELSISAINLSIDEKFIHSNIDAKVGPYILVTVSDTGSGIAATDLDKIFEPFFSTKAPSQGTGLGLSTVHGIIKNHGGFITVYSELEKGSQFKVYLPATEAVPIVPMIDPDLPRGSGEMILVIDDEVPICETTQHILETYGYQVLTGSDGIEAIALYAKNQGHIHAVLMDMTLPSMDGMTAAQTLQKINPNIKLILMSGLSSNEKIARTLGLGVRAFLAKPFSSATLLHTLAEVLRINDLTL